MPVFARRRDGRFFSLVGSSRKRQTGNRIRPAAPLTFEKGEAIAGQSCFHRALAVILKGQVEVFRTGPDGPRVMMNRLTAGQMFGAASLFGETDECYTEIAAVRRCVILFISQEKVGELIRRYPAVAENYIRFLSGPHPVSQPEDRRFYQRHGGQPAVPVSAGAAPGGRLRPSAAEHGGAGSAFEHRPFQPVSVLGRADSGGSGPPGGKMSVYGGSCRGRPFS